MSTIFYRHTHEYLTFNIYYTSNLKKSYTKIDIFHAIEKVLCKYKNHDLNKRF